MLFGNFASCLTIALAGGYLGAIAGLSPALVIVMATVGFTMDAEGDALFVTTAVALIISAVATGACCLLIGRFPTRQSSPLYPLSGDGWVCSWDRGSRLSSSHVADGSQTGLADDPRALGAFRAVEVEPGCGVWDRLVLRD